ncbi:MAG: WcaF family extracellular polysaccharide biosynthesis acetyltransferase [Bacteroidia bacterium]|nr:WcaF family extracellular polysaccharide biosynthesis acetyltransferase [Bacteroidia bacterium]
MSERKPVNLRTFNNDWYQPGAGILVRTLWYLVNVLFFLNPFNPISSIKILMLRLFGAKIGQRVNIKPSVNIKYPWLLEVGDDVWIGENVWIDNLAKVSLGNNTCLSQGSLLLTGNHNFSLPGFDLMVGEIMLEEGVWIGAKSVVCPGVRCHSHAVLAVGSVATHDLEPYGIYQGNPAQKVRERVIK